MAGGVDGEAAGKPGVHIIRAYNIIIGSRWRWVSSNEWWARGGTDGKREWCYDGGRPRSGVIRTVGMRRILKLSRFGRNFGRKLSTEAEPVEAITTRSDRQNNHKPRDPKTN